MKTPLSWIKSMVSDLECTPKEYADALTLSGTKAESIEYLDKNLENIVIAKIKKIERHPNADKLFVCQAQIDEEGKEVQIVTGATNLFEGAVVPAVLDGGRVATSHEGVKTQEGTKIKAGELRGVMSNGMFCSIAELGREKNLYPEAPENGIYLFNEVEGYEELKIGSDAVLALGLRDAVIEYEVTSNRVDCFGVLGIAREAAATFRKPFHPPVIKDRKKEGHASDLIAVEIKDDDLCSRFVAGVVKNVKIAPSPVWMQRRLSAVGIRPINNIVDITNYVMTELGQPMHAYDLNTIEERKIIVERAKDGETFITLDGEERELDSTMLLIKDGKKGVGIAGIMGGENSKIQEEIDTVLLEAACFNGTNIRRTSKKLGLRTDASSKFEKGLDPNTAWEAMNRALSLIEELKVGEVVEGLVDVYPHKREDRFLDFHLDACNKLLGTDITLETAREYFDRLGIRMNEDGTKVTVPSFRQDILRNADLAEELARFYGYDKIPVTLPSGESTSGGIGFSMQVEEAARGLAENFGFMEAMTFSFESPKVFDKLLYAPEAKERETIKILNPLGEDYSIMRTQIVAGMLKSLATNYTRKNKNVRLYEISNIYLAKSLPLTDYPEERKQFALGMYGEGDFFYLKGVVEEFLLKAGMKERPVYVNEGKESFLHPGRQAEIFYEGEVIGYLGEVHPLVLSHFEIGVRAYLANLDLKKIVEKANFNIKYTGIAKYPAVGRDISLIMEKSLTCGEIEAVIRREAGHILESLELFDIYEGERIESGKKSMAYSIVFRHKEKTLEDAEITEVMNRIFKELSAIGAELRM